VKQPPTILSDAMVVAYAILDESIAHSGRGSLVVDGKRLGRVPRLAIARSAAHVLLLHCSPTWKVLGTAGFASVSEAERSAERTYPGISRKWQRMRVTKRQAEAFLKALWKGQECSFCQRRPDQVEKIVSGRGGVRICDVCIREIREKMHDDPGT
jgi:ClpX C4-type zinc finger